MSILAADGLLTDQIQSRWRTQSPWIDYRINLVLCLICGLVCLWWGVHWYTDGRQARQSAQECTGPLSNPAASCYEENTSVRFEEVVTRSYGRHSHRDYQDYAYVHLSDGRQMTEKLSSLPASLIVVNGMTDPQLFPVRVWRGQVIGIEIDGEMRQTYDDPAYCLGDDIALTAVTGTMALAALIPWRRQRWTRWSGNGF